MFKLSTAAGEIDLKRSQNLTKIIIKKLIVPSYYLKAAPNT
ncbi:MAG: hypothetical protein V7K67_16445 [Nostoc sp.]